MVKTKEDARKMLVDIAERKGLLNVSAAAIHVLQNYEEYDYNGADQLFLAYCEEFVENITLDEKDFDNMMESLITEESSVQTKDK